MDQLNVRGATGNRALPRLHFLGTVLGIGMFFSTSPLLAQVWKKIGTEVQGQTQAQPQAQPSQGGQSQLQAPASQKPGSAPTSAGSSQNAQQTAPSENGTAYMFCFSGGINNTMYYTDIFPLTIQQRRQGEGAQRERIGKAFYDYLINKGLTTTTDSGGAQCEIRPTEQDAKAYKQQCQSNPHDRKVETHWTGTGSALQASGPHKGAVGFMYCRGRGHAANTDYFAGVFPTSVQINPQRPDMGGVFIEGGEAFYHYLASQGLADDDRQPSTRLAVCYVSPREADAAKEMQDAEQMSTATNRRIVKINWTYK